MMRKNTPWLYLLILLLLTGCESSLSFDEYIKKAENYSAQGNNDKAIDTYKKALQLKPQDSTAHYALGSLYYEEWRAAARQGATNLAELIKYNAKLKNLSDLAASEYNKALQNDQGNWRARYFVATDHYNNKRYQEAIKEFITVIKYNPNYCAAYYVLSDAYLAIGDHDLGMQSINKVHELDSDDEYYYYKLGKAYYFMKEESKGFEMERKLQALDSEYYDELLSYRFSHNREP